jgi:two-component system sensor histidine kinase KdpD
MIGGRLASRSPGIEPRSYAETLLMVGAVTAIGRAGAPWLPASATDLLYLLPVLAAAGLYGRGPGIAAGVASALAYNFFFVEPLHTLMIGDIGSAITVLMLLVVALVTSQLAAGFRDEAARATAEARRNAALAGFARQLVGASKDALGDVIAAGVAPLFEANALVVTADAGGVVIAGAFPRQTALDRIEAQAAQLTLSRGVPAGRGTAELQTADWSFYPMVSSGRIVAALGLARDDGREVVDTHRQPLLAALLAQGALALERQSLAREMQDVAQLRERDRLRGALLSSVGHDLRTPLTAIRAATAALRGAAEDDLLATLETEAKRLDRYIGNLLDMARIEAGAVRLAIEPIDLVDAATAAAADMRPDATARLDIEVPADLPLVRADPQLLHHCLINLLDNALRHGGSVTIAATSDADGVRLKVLDDGPGLRAGLRPFDGFAKIEGSDRVGGSGLGLAIVKSFALAMGIEPAAGNREKGGACFELRFPTALLVGAT